MAKKNKTLLQWFKEEFDTKIIALRPNGELKYVIYKWNDTVIGETRLVFPALWHIDISIFELNGRVNDYIKEGFSIKLSKMIANAPGEVKHISVETERYQLLSASVFKSRRGLAEKDKSFRQKLISMTVHAIDDVLDRIKTGRDPVF